MRSLGSLCNNVFFFHGNRHWIQDSPCTATSACRGDRGLIHSSLCTATSAGRGCRWTPLRTPCSDTFAGHACRHRFLRILCIKTSADRGCISYVPFPRNPRTPTSACRGSIDLIHHSLCTATSTGRGYKFQPRSSLYIDTCAVHARICHNRSIPCRYISVSHEDKVSSCFSPCYNFKCSTWIFFYTLGLHHTPTINI